MLRHIFDARRLSVVAALLVLAACTKRPQTYVIEVTPVEHILRPGSTCMSISASERIAIQKIIKELEIGKLHLAEDSVETPAIEIVVENTKSRPDLSSRIANARVAAHRANEGIHLIRELGWTGPILVKFVIQEIPCIKFSAASVSEGYKWSMLSEIQRVFGSDITQKNLVGPNKNNKAKVVKKPAAKVAPKVQGTQPSHDDHEEPNAEERHEHEEDRPA